MQKTFAPGNSWAGSEGSPSAEHAISREYHFNTEGDEVHTWTITNNPMTYMGDDVTTNVPTTSATTVYAPGTLQEILTIDENGKKVVTYTDFEGKLVLKKVQLANSPGFNHEGWLCTYYIYDDFGKLRCIITPEAVSLLLTAEYQWNITSNNYDLLKNFCFRFEYDDRGRLIAKKTPGNKWLYLVYDNKNRVVYTQDGNLRAKNQWLINLYDFADRTVMTGLINRSANTITPQELTSYLEGITNFDQTSTLDGVTININPIPASTPVISFFFSAQSALSQ